MLEPKDAKKGRQSFIEFRFVALFGVIMETGDVLSLSLCLCLCLFDKQTGRTKDANVTVLVSGS